MTPHEELCLRLAADRGAIEAAFGGGGASGPVQRIETGLSDPHDGGRTVATVTFEDGLRVVYKPRPVGLEAAYRQLLEWWNRRAGDLTLRAAGVVDRGAYGWMECIAPDPCPDDSAAGRYYERAGALICLASLLDATDLHHGNVIAHGEYPVVVDLETLLHPRWPGEERSLLDTGLVPCWIQAPDGKPYDVSGFGAIATQRYRGRSVPVRQNVVWLAGEVVSPAAYADRIATGFERAADLLISLRGELTSAEGPLEAFAHQRVRVILRHTLSYSEALGTPGTPPAGPLLREVCDPRLLRAITRAERHALGEHDIPRFNASTDTVDWTVSPELTVRGVFARASHAALMDRASRLDRATALEQVRLLATALTLWEVGNRLTAGTLQAGAGATD